MMVQRFAALLFLLLFLNGFTYAQVKHNAKPAHYNLAASIANGKKVYVQYCLSCHQANGGGVQNMNPPLIQTSYVLGDKATLIKIVLNGFNEDVQINGQTYSNNMAPHDFLKDKEIADVLTYVRHSFTNKAGAVTTKQVKKVRAANKKVL